MITIAFFNNKGGVGKTSLVYHLAWMFAEMEINVVAADLDPQANLTSLFLNEDRLEEIWPIGKHPLTIQGVIDPLVRGMGDIAAPHVEHITSRIGLIPGDLGLSGFEDKLSAAWPLCHNGDEAAFRATTAFYRAAAIAAKQRKAEVVLMDVGPNLGAINRCALIAARYVVIPLASDLFSLQGLRNLGPHLRGWRNSWTDLRTKSFLSGEIEPAGYVVLQHAMRDNRPVKAYQRWMKKIPGEYREHVLAEPPDDRDLATDPDCLATLKHYRSLMPLAMEARKPMFFLKPADGAIGAHTYAVKDCFNDFERLAKRIAIRCGIEKSDPTDEE